MILPPAAGLMEILGLCRSTYSEEDSDTVRTARIRIRMRQKAFTIFLTKVNNSLLLTTLELT